MSEQSESNGADDPDLVTYGDPGSSFMQAQLAEEHALAKAHRAFCHDLGEPLIGGLSRVSTPPQHTLSTA